MPGFVVKRNDTLFDKKNSNSFLHVIFREADDGPIYLKRKREW